MKQIVLPLKNRTYPICIGQGLLAKTGTLIQGLGIGKDAVIITNATIKKKFFPALSRSLKAKGFSTQCYTVPDSEKAKSIKYCLHLIDSISRYDKGRQVFFIALGGGVIGDLTGFIASVYKRGTAYVQIPTTLLAQIDSAIGGKTAIDLTVAKNLVGAFHQPKIVTIDTSLLSTLPPRQIKSGLAEVIKYAVIKDAALFSFLQRASGKIMKLDIKALTFIEERCIRIKAAIVSKDEREQKGIRTILNFGHTIGHAVESAAGYRTYTHGEAIAIGMVCASQIAECLGILKKNDAKKIKALIELYQLPTAIRQLPLQKILNALARDKKFLDGKNRFVLPVGIGKVVVKKGIPKNIIRRVIEKNTVAG